MKFLNCLKYDSRNFGSRIFYLFAVFILIISVSFTVFIIYQQSKTLNENLKSEGRLLANLLAYNSRLGIFAENEEMLQTPVEGIVRHKEVILVQVFTADGRELKTMGSLEKENPGKDYPKLQDRTLFISAKSGPVFFDGNGIVDFLAPVVSSEGYSAEEDLYFRENQTENNNVTGYVRIVLTKKHLNKDLQAIILKSIFIPVVFLISGWIIAFFIVKGITKPLDRLTEGVEAIKTTGSFKSIPVDTNDETAKLATAFNEMAESLKKREAEKQQLEEHLRHAQKMKAVGTLAGGIAHDFNNIISVIMGYGHLLQNENIGKDLAKQYLDHLLSSAERAAALTQRLLTFSRRQMMNLCPVNLNGIISNVGDIIARLISENMLFRVELAEEDLVVTADAGQIEQVMMNLATNARDAMPDGGTLTIGTKPVILDKQSIISSEDGKPGKYALISVTDTGTGMDRETKERIFDPFFTTKDSGEGTGLGLSMVYGIVKRHGGYIDVRSKPGQGTTIDIYLPLSDSVVKDIEPEKTPQLKGGEETILVAEDDGNVRRLATTVLRSHGYKIIEAVNGRDAIEKFIEHKEKIHFLLLDLKMPLKNGKEVYDEIRKIRADIKALFISGHPGDIIDIDGEAAKDIDFLHKPVSPDKLIRKIREVLDG